ncbi:YhcN/YlaJ family sporulation lipoprotein [Sutcliffiella horikoshii]|uniref:YhcN/YlaJ family sporulation lipoprotein n=1 Tax=Sutcliffiella horikoshii TaxID=79883 RepID=UPI0020424DA6|nr:YhcN/YlaJ family sporulation lipoprotein [Sutcliffiella horikoshii]MCM3615953.1 YhcN/YlaJ family sporulation lipoprotein [Sutcliffiella horikoshii]
MKLKGIVVTGLALTMLVTGCGNVDEYGTARQDNQDDALNVNYDNMGRYTENVRRDRVNPRRVNETNQPRIEVADEASKRITDLKEVKSSNVLVTDRNAYVAAVLEGENKELSNDVEEKIANQVRKTDRSIRNVYVSVNPEFVDRMEGYTNDINEGRPITGIFDEFTEMVQRVFPNRR